MNDIKGTKNISNTVLGKNSYLTTALSNKTKTQIYNSRRNKVTKVHKGNNFNT